VRLRLFCLVAALGVLLSVSCGGSRAEPRAEAAPRRAIYRPGQSLAARLCECRECFDIACCAGDAAESDESPEDELGMSLSVCSRCTRRVWTVRENEDCSTRAPPQCCPASIRD